MCVARMTIKHQRHCSGALLCTEMNNGSFRFLVMLSALLAALSVTAHAQEQISAEEFLASLNFQKGTITLPGGVANLTLPEGFHYLSPRTRNAFW